MCSEIDIGLCMSVISYSNFISWQFIWQKAKNMSKMAFLKKMVWWYFEINIWKLDYSSMLFPRGSTKTESWAWNLWRLLFSFSDSSAVDFFNSSSVSASSESGKIVKSNQIKHFCLHSRDVICQLINHWLWKPPNTPMNEWNDSLKKWVMHSIH